MNRQGWAGGFLALTLLLAGCVSPGRPRGSDGPLTWGYGEQPIRLLLGVEGTDNVFVGWVCDKGGVALWSPYDDPEQVVRLRSGGAVKDYPLRASSAPDGEDGGKAPTTLSDPVLREFMRTGRLSMRTDGGSWSVLDARGPAERAEIARFDHACRGLVE